MKVKIDKRNKANIESAIIKKWDVPKGYLNLVVNILLYFVNKIKYTLEQINRTESDYDGAIVLCQEVVLVGILKVEIKIDDGCFYLINLKYTNNRCGFNSIRLILNPNKSNYQKTFSYEHKGIIKVQITDDKASIKVDKEEIEFDFLFVNENELQELISLYTHEYTYFENEVKSKIKNYFRVKKINKYIKA